MTSGEPTSSDRELVARIARLPDLLKRARAQFDPGKPERDVYVIQAELGRRLTQEGKAHVSSVPYRSPPSASSTGAHQVPHIEVTVYSPRAKAGLLETGATMAFWKRDLHEVEAHGRPLSSEERAFLQSLPRL